VAHEYGITLLDKLEGHVYDAVVLAVAHTQFKTWTKDDFLRVVKEAHVLYDIKHLLDRSWVDGRL